MPDSLSVTDLTKQLQTAISLVGIPSLALIQGYPFTRLLDSVAVLESVQRQNTWDDFFDLRIFGPKGEWHAWNLGNGKWGARFWDAEKQDKTLQLDREFPLWGNEVGRTENGWSLLREAKGAAVWVPQTAAVEPRGDGSTIAILNAVELVGYDKSTGLAGIVDCALRTVETNPHGI